MTLAILCCLTSSTPLISIIIVIISLLHHVEYIYLRQVCWFSRGTNSDISFWSPVFNCSKHMLSFFLYYGQES